MATANPKITGGNFLSVVVDALILPNLDGFWRLLHPAYLSPFVEQEAYMKHREGNYLCGKLFSGEGN
jgi:hypothetical protein